MQDLRWLVLPLAVIAVIGNVGAFTETNKLLTSLDDLHTQASLSIACFSQLKATRMSVAQLFNHGAGLFLNLPKIQSKTEAIKAELAPLASFPLLKPVAQVLNVGLNFLDQTVGEICSANEPFVEAISGFNDNVIAIEKNATSRQRKLIETLVTSYLGETHIFQVATNITMLECNSTRFDLIANIEGAASGMDTTPNMVTAELKKAEDVCHEVKTIFNSESAIMINITHGLHDITEAMEAVTEGLHAIHFLVSEMNRVLHTEICESDVKKFVMKQLMTNPEMITEVLANTEITEVFNLLARKRRSFLTDRLAALQKKKPERCTTVGEILSKVNIPKGAFKTIAEDLLEDFILEEDITHFTMPNVTAGLMHLVPTWMPRDFNLDLEMKVKDMLPDVHVLDAFLAMDYTQTFWEAPVISNMSTPHTCPDEIPLIDLSTHHGHS